MSIFTNNKIVYVKTIIDTQTDYRKNKCLGGSCSWDQENLDFFL